MSGGNPSIEKPFRGRLARNTLLILLLLTLLPLLLLGSAAYLRTRALLRDQVFSLLTTVSQVQGDRISGEIATGRQLLARAAVKPAVSQPMHIALGISDHSQAEYLNARNEFFDQLQTVNQPKPYFSQFIVVNPDGIIQISTNRGWEGERLPATGDISTKANQAGSRAIFDFKPLYDQSLVILTSIPYLNAQGELLATIIGISEPTVLRDFMGRAAFFTEGNYFVPSNGIYIGINPFADSFEKLILFEPSDELNFYMEYLSNQLQRSGVRELVSFYDRPVIAAYTWLPDLQVGWLAEIPQSNVYQQLNSLLVFIAILLAITMLSLGFLVWQVTRYLVRPMTRLAASVTQFSAGNWDVRAEVKRNDELGQLADSFNKMATDLSILYQSLESKVDERTRQLQASNELGQFSVTATDLDELLWQTVTLLAKRFGYPFAAIYLLDESGEYAVIRQVAAPPEILPRLRGQRVKVEPLSLVGWVAMSRNTKVDLIGQGAFGAIDRVDLVPDVRAEAGIPILHAGNMLGVLVVQSYRASDLNEDTIQELQSLANQISPALQNFYLLEATQIDLQETNLLYQASHQIAQAEDEQQIYQLGKAALLNTPYHSAMLVAREHYFNLVWDSMENDSEMMPVVLAIDPQIVNQQLPPSGPILGQFNQKQNALPAALSEWLRTFGRGTLALIPVRRAGQLQTILVLKASQDDVRTGLRFSSLHLQPYINLIELITNTLEKVNALRTTQKRLSEMEILSNLSRDVSQQTNLEALFATIHRYVSNIFGEVDFLLAQYDPDNHQIQVPYAYEQGQRLQVPSIPSGQGLTSLVIRSRKPLRLVSTDDWRALPAGSAVVFGKEAVSWLGAPMVVGGEVVGVLAVQDVQRDQRFSLDDERFFSTFANQVAVVIRNTTLLEATRQRAYAESLLNEITGNIRRSMTIPEILATTTTELGQALRVRKAKITIRAPQTGAAIDPVNQNKDNLGQESTTLKPTIVDGEVLHGD